MFEIVRNRQARHSNRQITAATLVAKRSGDFPVPCMAGWKTQTGGGHSCPQSKTKAGLKTRPPAWETDKALKEILVKNGV
jgi:hypothetical protein